MRARPTSQSCACLFATSAFIAGCASGPTDIVMVNAVHLPYSYASPVTNDIFDAARPFDHPAIQNLRVCTLRMDETVQLTRNAAGGLFDVRTPDNVANGTFQAALIEAGGACHANNRVQKIEITLNQGLAVMTPTTAGQARALINSEVTTLFVNVSGPYVAVANSPYLSFTLERVDTNPQRARSRGTFRLMAPYVDGVSLLLIDGSFNLRAYQFNPTFVP